MIIQKTAENITEFKGADFLFWLFVTIALTAFCCFIFKDSQQSDRMNSQRRSAIRRRR